MLSVYTMSLSYLEDMRMLWPDRFTPYYLASVGCHLLNLRNRKQLGKGYIFHTEGGLVPDIRLHVLMVCPSGYGKSYTPKRFIAGKSMVGLLDRSSITAVFRGYMTEAGLVGTFKDGEEIRGLASTHRDAIICLNELSAVSSEGQDSKRLEEALLDFLDDGQVRKTLSGGEIAYQSYATLWAGTQQGRFRLAAGMARRLFLMEFLPTRLERRQLKLNKRAARGIKPDFQRLGQIYRAWDTLKNELSIQELDWDEDLYDYMDELDPDMSHNDEELYSRLAMGYNLVRYYEPGEKVLQVSLDGTLEDLIYKGYQWRQSILGDSAGSQILSLLREHPDGMPLSQLKKQAQVFSLTYGETADILRDLERHEAINMARVKTSGRPVTIVRAMEDF
jgi:hypothetical protein